MSQISKDFIPLLSSRLKMADSTVIPLPFAINSTDRAEFPLSHNAKKVNYTSGIPQAFEVSPMSGGCAVTRDIFNEIGYESSLGGFLWQAGICPTFNQAISDKIGGYPQGTILKDFSKTFEDNDKDFAIVRDVISLQDNNTKNFVYSKTNPEPYEIGSEDEDGIVWWKYLDDEEDASIYAPNYLKKTQIITINCKGNNSYSWTSEANGWILIRIQAKDTIDWLQGAMPSFPLKEALYRDGQSMSHITQDLHPNLARVDKDETSPISSKVYYYGYSTDQDSWNGRTSKTDTEYMIYSSDYGKDMQIIFPTNEGIVHKVFGYVGTDSPILDISIYLFETFSEPSEE